MAKKCSRSRSSKKRISRAFFIDKIIGGIGGTVGGTFTPRSPHTYSLTPRLPTQEFPCPQFPGAGVAWGGVPTQPVTTPPSPPSTPPSPPSPSPPSPPPTKPVPPQSGEWWETNHW